jgi:hypothetical protein
MAWWARWLARRSRAPKYNAAVNATYNFSAWERPSFVMAGMQWVGSSKGSLDPDADRPRSSGLSHHRLQRGHDVWRYAFTAFVKNAFDTDTIIQHPQVASIVQGYRLAPRSIGVSLATKF